MGNPSTYCYFIVCNFPVERNICGDIALDLFDVLRDTNAIGRSFSCHGPIVTQASAPRLDLCVLKLLVAAQSALHRVPFPGAGLPRLPLAYTRLCGLEETQDRNLRDQPYAERSSLI